MNLEKQLAGIVKQIQKETRLGDKRAEQFYNSMFAENPAVGEYAKFTATGLEGRSYSEVLSDLSGEALAAFGWNGQALTNVGNITCNDVFGNFLYSDAVTPRFYMRESGTTRAEFRYGAAANAWIVLTGNLAGIMTNRIIVRGEQDFTSVGIGMTPPVATVLAIVGATENIEIIDAGSVGATQQDWIEVEIGGVQGYIRVFAAK